MNTATNQNIVHESESQRQYARIKIPARVIFELGAEKKRLIVSDLSAGGFAFKWGGSPVSAQGYKGHLEFNMGGFVFIMPIQFDIRNVDKEGRAGCSFQNMGQRETASLRHIITAFLSGELVAVGDMINIVGRDNFSKERSKKSGAGLQGLSKIKAVVGSVLFLVAGLIAFGYVATRLFDVLALGKSTAAVFLQDTHVVTTPREGVIELLVKEGDQVEAGQIIGTFSSPVVSFLGESLSEGQMNSDVVQTAINNSYIGSLVSPCDCEVQTVYVSEKEYATKNKQVLSLAQTNQVPFVRAEFNSGAAQHLYNGKPVTISAAGVEVTGTVKEFRSNVTDTGLSTSLNVKIEINEDTLLDLVSGTPVIVKYSKFRFFDEL